MRRLIAAVSIVAAGVLGFVRPAPAAAWMWIAAPNWSYSAAYADSPAGAIYFWALFDGPTYASAYSFSGLNAATASAAATPGVGGVGVADVTGWADPYADITIPSSGSSPFGYALDPNNNSEVDGITFSYSDSEMGDGDDEIAAFLFDEDTNKDSQCAVLNNGTCPANSNEQSSGGTHPAGAAGLEHDGVIGNHDLLGEVDNLNGSGSYYLQFPSPIPLSDLTDSTGPQLVLMAYGTAAPEPASIVLLASGLVVLGFLGRRRRRQGG